MVLNSYPKINLPWGFSGRQVIERILRHLGLWEQGVRVSPKRAPPEIGDQVIDAWLDDPFPDYDTEPVRNYPNG